MNHHPSGLWRTLLVFLSLFTPLLSQAKWEKQDDAAAHIEDAKTFVKVNRDYSLEITDEFTAVIDKQEAIKDFSIIQSLYVPEVSQMKILAARTIINGQIYNVDPRLVEDKAVAQPQQGYDSFRSIRLALPQLTVGAKVYIKMWEKTLPHPLPGFISEMIPFGDHYPVHSHLLQLEAAAPIQYKVIDPRRQLAVLEKRTSKSLSLTLRTTATIFQGIKDEPFSAFSGPQTPVLVLSSGSNWSEFGNRIAEEYEKVIQGELPPDFKQIAETAKKQKDPLDQVEQVLTRLQKLVHYLGVWQTVKGKYFPRPLSEVAMSRFGDCKDYASATVAILRSLGLDATLAWTMVETGMVTSQMASAPKMKLVNYQPPLPGMFFNHAIVKLNLAGKTYWLDPTSPIPYARGTQPHLAGSYALTLKRSASQIETLPLPSPDENYVKTTTFVSLNSDRTADEITRVQVKGYTAAALKWKQSEEKASLDHIETVLSESSIEKPKEDSAAPNNDFSFDKGESSVDLAASTSAGAGIKFRISSTLYPFIMDHAQTVGDILISTPGRVLEETYIQGGKLLGQLPANCSVETSWFKASRKMTQDGDLVKVVEDIEITQALIQNPDLLGKPFKTAGETLKKCWSETTLVFQPDERPLSNHSFSVTEPWRLRDWDIKKIKMTQSARATYASVREYLKSPEPKKPIGPSIQIAPEWSKDKTITQLQAKAFDLIENYAGGPLRLLTAKFLLLDALQQEPENPVTFALLGFCDIKLGYISNEDFEPKALERAKLNIDHALALNPLDPQANRTLASFLIKNKQPTEGLAQAQFALKLEPESKEGHKLFGYALLKNNRAEDALAEAEKSDSYDLKIKIYTALKRYDDVAATYELEIKNAPNAWAFLNYSSFLTSRDKVDQAIEVGKKSIQFRETGMGHRILSDAYTYKAATLIKSGKMAEAMSLYQNALEEKNDNADAQYGMGWILMKLSNEKKDVALLQKAIEHLSLAANLDPSNKERQGALIAANAYLNYFRYGATIQRIPAGAIVRMKQ